VGPFLPPLFSFLFRRIAAPKVYFCTHSGPFEHVDLGEFSAFFSLARSAPFCPTLLPRCSPSDLHLFHLRRLTFFYPSPPFDTVFPVRLSPIPIVHRSSARGNLSFFFPLNEIRLSPPCTCRREQCNPSSTFFYRSGLRPPFIRSYSRHTDFSFFLHSSFPFPRLRSSFFFSSVNVSFLW